MCIRDSFQQVKLLAHKIKPNIDLFQIVELQEPIREIEKNAEEQNQEVLGKLVKNLAHVYTEVASEMRQVIDKSWFSWLLIDQISIEFPPNTYQSWIKSEP